jgi:hypothetical protein
MYQKQEVYTNFRNLRRSEEILHYALTYVSMNLSLQSPDSQYAVP